MSVDYNVYIGPFRRCINSKGEKDEEGEGVITE